MKHLLTIAALAATSCLSGPEQVAPSRARVTRDSHGFPVATGAHGDMDCNACHGPFDTFTQFSCITCHEHDQATTSASHVAVASFTWTETSCYDCHATGGTLDRGSHGPLFPISSGGPHEKIACNECHADGYDTFACINCHEHLCTDMDDKHSEVGSYTCTSVRCRECHPQGRNDD